MQMALTKAMRQLVQPNEPLRAKTDEFIKLPAIPSPNEAVVIPETGDEVRTPEGMAAVRAMQLRANPKWQEMVAHNRAVADTTEPIIGMRGTAASSDAPIRDVRIMTARGVPINPDRADYARHLLERQAEVSRLGKERAADRYANKQAQAGNRGPLLEAMMRRLGGDENAKLLAMWGPEAGSRIMEAKLKAETENNRTALLGDPDYQDFQLAVAGGDPKQIAATRARLVAAGKLGGSTGPETGPLAGLPYDLQQLIQEQYASEKGPNLAAIATAMRLRGIPQEEITRRLQGITGNPQASVGNPSGAVGLGTRIGSLLGGLFSSNVPTAMPPRTVPQNAGRDQARSVGIEDAFSEARRRQWKPAF